jgi:hypothetical protein
MPQTADQILQPPNQQQPQQDGQSSQGAPPEATKALRAQLEGQLGIGELQNMKETSVQAGPFYKVLEDPNSTQADKDNAYTQLGKLYKSKQAKEKIGRAQQIQGVLGKLSAFMKGQTSQGREEQSQSRLSAQQSQQRIKEQQSESASRVGEKEAESKADFERRKADISERVKQGDLTPREGAELLWNRNLTTPQPGTRKVMGYKLPDGTTKYVQWDQKSGKNYDPSTNEEVTLPDGATPLPPNTSGVPRVIGHISAKDAQAQAKQGRTFADEAGNDIDLANLPDDMQLTEVVIGGKDFYSPLSQSQTHFTVGGQVYAVPSLDQIDLAKGAGVELGPSRTPTATSHQVITQGPGGRTRRLHVAWDKYAIYPRHPR